MLTSMDLIEGAAVLDLFAGSGALGIEALSRGARSAVFVDTDRLALEAVAGNLRTAGFADERAAVRRQDALQYVRAAGPVELVLADPPYAWDGWAELLEALAGRAGVVVAESSRPVDAPPAWQTVKTKQYGTTVVTVLQACDQPESVSSR
jgi:16S rRNA (guanine966-N2)-methyltransferase